MSTTPPAGWYPDNGGDGLRYWDGQSWTNHTSPSQPVVPQASGRAASGQAAVLTETAPAEAPHAWRTPAEAPVTSQPSWFARHKILSAVLAFVVLMMVAAALGGGGEDPAGSMPDASAADTQEVEVAEETESGTEPETEPAAEPEPVDSDGDGVVDDEDFAPENAKVQTQDDVDTDKDGVPDYKDAFPKDAKYSKDADGDGVADGLDAFPKDDRWSKDSDGDRVADSEDAFPQDPSRSEITLAMENALESAQDYLAFSAFSRQGLIDQLSSEYGSGYRVEDATWAVDHLKVNWNEQAVEAAKDYLDFSSFSRQGLIDQLSSPYGSQFTVAQATYAVNQIGL